MDNNLDKSKIVDRLVKLNEELLSEVAKRYKAEEDLKESENTVRTILEATPVGICLLKDRVFQWANNNMAEILGYTIEELIGKNTETLYVSQDEYNRIGRLGPSQILKDNLANLEFKLRRKDGRIIDCYVRERPLDPKDLNKGYISILMDITDRKKDEKKLNETLEILRISNAKIESVNKELNDFAYIVSHDLKAPLRAVASLATWLMDDYSDKLDEDGKESLKLLFSRVKRMDSLIDGILRYSRAGRMKRESENVDLNTTVLEILDNIDPPEKISIEIINKLPTIFVDKTQTMELFQNLLSNAIKYMDKSDGKIIIGFTEDEDYYQFSVSDNGPGIEEKYYEKIFQIFQTLNSRDEVEGTGVGLTIVRKIIDNFGGKIWVESEIGKGSTFFFTIPKKYGVEA